MFDGFTMRQEPTVLLTREDGTIEALLAPEEAGDDVEELSGILSPGFINTHCHLELSHMKGMIPEATGLVDFVFKVVSQRHVPDQEILQAIEKAEDEMLANGIVAAGDICNNALSIPQKLKGRIWYHNFIEASGFHPEVVEQRFQRSAGFFAAYSKLYSIPVESNSITPHAPYSVADELWEKIIHFPGNHLFTIHNQESGAEDQWFMYKEGEMKELFAKMKIDVSHFQPSGKSSLQTYLPRFLNNQSLILVHNVYTRQEDLVFARKTGRQLHWCLCPNANWYISRRLPDIDLLIRENCEIVLGTDSLASNHQLSILEEMKTIQTHFPHIKIEQMLPWATSKGAKALQVQPLMGSFEKGKKPGVLLIAPDLSSLKRLV
ncbi:MAG TPA: amidohydrolase family protein [Chitinophagaceae bacterium]|nr:amidohydrolase family protein [Chitinophagaceae bacterium]